MTIYFDKRALEQQKKEDEEIKQEELDKKAEKERNEEKGKEVVNAIGNLFLSPLALMLVWNACIPEISQRRMHVRGDEALKTLETRR